MTYEADQTGTLHIVAGEGDTLPIGDVIARIGEGGDEREAAGAAEGRRRRRARGGPGGRHAEPAAERPTRRPPDAEGGERLKASPVARRMARELSVDLDGMQGSGPGGRIVKADVEAAATATGPGVRHRRPPRPRRPESA